MIEQPLIIPVIGGYKLVCDYVYEWEADGRKFRIIVERGFFHDGASVPRFLWTITGITPDGLHRAAALIHDFIYRFNGELPNGSFWGILGQNKYVGLPNVKWTREQADKLFVRMLREAKVSKVKRRLMYHGVRLGGWRHWKN